MSRTILICSIVTVLLVIGKLQADDTVWLDGRQMTTTQYQRIMAERRQEAAQRRQTMLRQRRLRGLLSKEMTRQKARGERLDARKALAVIYKRQGVPLPKSLKAYMQQKYGPKPPVKTVKRRYRAPSYRPPPVGLENAVRNSGGNSGSTCTYGGKTYGIGSSGFSGSSWSNGDDSFRYYHNGTIGTLQRSGPSVYPRFGDR